MTIFKHKTFRAIFLEQRTIHVNKEIYTQTKEVQWFKQSMYFRFRALIYISSTLVSLSVIINFRFVSLDLLWRICFFNSKFQNIQVELICYEKKRERKRSLQIKKRVIWMILVMERNLLLSRKLQILIQGIHGY